MCVGVSSVFIGVCIDIFQNERNRRPPPKWRVSKGGTVRFTCLVGLEVVLDVDGLALLVHVLEGVRPVPVICMYRNCGVAIKISRSASLVRVRHTGTHTHTCIHIFIF